MCKFASLPPTVRDYRGNAIPSSQSGKPDKEVPGLTRRSLLQNMPPSRHWRGVCRGMLSLNCTGAVGQG